MIDQQEKLLDAAIQTFVRFGFRKATMADIAREAGVSRPTLYASFRSKDEILGACIRGMAAASLERVQSGWQGDETLSEKIDTLFQSTVVPAFELLQSSPYSDDLISGHSAAGKAAIIEARVNTRSALMEVLAPHEKSIQQTGQSVSQFAHFVVITAQSMKYAADSKAELDDLLASLKASVLSVVGE